jgi:hypothetical protein
MFQEQDCAIAASMNEAEYLEEGQGIECGCCFGCCPFERMVQCMDSHLFCMACLRGYAKEAIYGEGKVSKVYLYVFLLLVCISG